MITTIDVANLRERLAALPPDKQELARDRWPEHAGVKVPSLRDGGLDVEQLAAVEALVLSLEGGPTPPGQGGEETTLTSDLEARRRDLRYAISQLPDDLIDAAKKKWGTLRPLSKVTDAEELDAIRDYLAEFVDTQNARVARVQAACAEIDLKDDDRHSMIRLVTKGRVESSKKLAAADAQAVIDNCTAIALGWKVLGWEDDGAVLVGDVEGQPDWKATAEQHGLAQAELLRRAKRIAATLDQFPSSLKNLGAAAARQLLTELAADTTLATGDVPTADPAPATDPTPVAADLSELLGAADLLEQAADVIRRYAGAAA